MRINKEDVLWNYAATFLRIASYALLLPFILRKMSPEMVGIWSVFMAISLFSTLFDIGFSSSFIRNVTYIFSGVKSLKVSGFESGNSVNATVDFGLLKGIILAMRWIYLRMAITLFMLLSSLGTYYIYSLLKNYKGDQTEVYASWIVLVVISTYNLYSLYYDALLQGKGLIKRSKQITVIGQIIYILFATVLILQGYGLLAITSAQALSVIIIRWLSYHAFFTADICQSLNPTKPRPKKEVLRVIYPNAIKVGLTSFGAVVIQRSSIIIGSLFLPLGQIASYSITMQFIAIIAGFATIYTNTYTPKIVQLRVERNNDSIKTLYLKGQIIFFATYIVGAFFLMSLGGWILNLIGSQTQLMPALLISVAIIISFLESNHGMAGGILLTNNEVPFFKASLAAGLVTVLLLLVMFYFTNIALWSLILAPGIAQLYNNWKWPYELILQLNITSYDIKRSLKFITKF